MTECHRIATSTRTTVHTDYEPRALVIRQFSTAAGIPTHIGIPTHVGIPTHIGIPTYTPISPPDISYTTNEPEPVVHTSKETLYGTTCTTSHTSEPQPTPVTTHSITLLITASSPSIQTVNPTSSATLIAANNAPTTPVAVSSSSKLDLGAIVGVAIGGFVVCVLFITLIWLMLRRYKRRNADNSARPKRRTLTRSETGSTQPLQADHASTDFSSFISGSGSGSAYRGPPSPVTSVETRMYPGFSHAYVQEAAPAAFDNTAAKEITPDFDPYAPSQSMHDAHTDFASSSRHAIPPDYVLNFGDHDPSNGRPDAGGIPVVTDEKRRYGRS